DAQLDMRTPKNILIFDLGAGTCDVSIFEASYDTALLPSGIGLSIKNRAISNYEKLGGDNIDLHIVEEELLPIFCEKNLINFHSLPERVKRALRFSLKIKARQLKESICRQIAQEGFKKSIEQSWAIDPLSVASIPTRKTSGCIGFERFMKLMEPFVTADIADSFKVSDDYFTESFLSPVYNALKKADLGAEDIDAFIFNGGSCHNPIIRKNLQESEIFPKAKFFDTPDLDLSVSRGAAIHCYYLHKYGKPIVTPIVNSEIGIFTYGQKREPLVKAGTELPFPLKDGFSIYDNFFIPKDNLVSVGISIYSKDKYTRILSNLKLLLPEGTRKGEPVTIGVKIDSNKIMSFSAFMKNAPEVKIETEMSHPWTHNVHTPEDISANELWQKVADLKKQKNAVGHETMIELANKERKRGNIWGSLEILQRLQDKDINTWSLNNILALCYDAIGEENKALGYFKKAMELDPQHVVHITNYGYKLVDCKRIQEGISMLRQAVDMNSEYYASYLWLGRAYRAEGEEEQAKKEYTKARQILRDLTIQHPQNEAYLCSLESVNRSLGDYEDADMANKQLQDARSTKMLNG
ncbi:MAG: Hsp70 family protein, partial [Nitrospirota bacterium]